MNQEQQLLPFAGAQSSHPDPKNGRRRAALLIHGLGGTEYDLGRLRAVLDEQGVDAYVVALPGHGTRPEDLLGLRAEDWLDVVSTEYLRLSAQYKTLHVVGVCLGALLAIEVCKLMEHNKGKLVTLAAPLRLDGWSVPWYRAIRHVLYWIPSVARRWRVSEAEPYGIKNERIRRLVRGMLKRGDAFHYPWVPLASVREADRLRSMAWKGVERLKCPLMIMHATDDELTAPEAARALQRRVKGSTLHLLDNSYHMICVDNERGHVMHRVANFLADNARGPGQDAAAHAATHAAAPTATHADARLRYAPRRGPGLMPT
ncbi:carboxylesterase [Bordetella sp. N]|uniref:alpha/beta hydrolase n=1 Tax=Bordetella sp. N TaxID=1746199 RepID=UPI0009E99270|nr:alpha/beta fold hydrolase [Bordetella sp. N]